jgi:hypothetical protein
VAGAAPSSPSTCLSVHTRGDQPVHQIRQHARKPSSAAGGGALLDGAPALAGQLLAAGRLPELVVGNGAADGRVGGAELGNAPAVVQQGLQAGGQVGEAEASGPLVEVTLLAVDDGEATAKDKTTWQAGWWGCFPNALGVPVGVSVPGEILSLAALRRAQAVRESVREKRWG